MTKLLSMREAAVLMGFSDTHGYKTIQKYIKRGLLPCVRIGRTVRISEEAIKQLIDTHQAGRMTANTEHQATSTSTQED